VKGQESQAEIFDVFLCHNSEDKPAVREIAQKLAGEGIKPWLDVEQIRPGTTWQTALGEQIESIKSAAVFVGNSGIGPWQDEEIQALLSQFIDRKCPVIPTILASATTTPELPWTLKHRHRVDFRVPDPDPLRQLIWGITGQKPAAKEPLIPGKDELAASRRTSFGPRLFRPLAHPPDQDQIGQLEILRRRVNEYWIDGVLKNTLHNEVLISLGKREISDAVDAPWKYTVELSDSVSSGPLVDRDVNAIYDATGLLLILGEPGSGKSTTLLDLARTLHDRAEKDIKERIPIVLNLSTWKKQALLEWMSGELSEKYRVPRKIAHFWLQKNYLLPLLDGLDEVPTTLQPDCVTAINAFIEESNPPGLVVCSRLNEYRWLPERLKLNGAICLEPLSKDEVVEYFTKGGPELASLREAVNTDSVLQDLTKTPLMLNIMSLAYQGAGANQLTIQKGDSPEERRKHIFHLYVEQMFRRKGVTSLAFPKEKTLGWLSWLAGKMREHSQSDFLVEGLQPSWLRTRAEETVYKRLAALSLGLSVALSILLMLVLMLVLILGLLEVLGEALVLGLAILVGVASGCWLGSPLKNAAISGSIAGLIYGLIVGSHFGPFHGLIYALIIGLIVGLIGGLGTGSLNHITLVETMSWEWNRFWKWAIPGLVVLTGLGAAILVGLGEALRVGLILGLIFGLSVGLVSGLVGGFTDKVKVDKTSPNQGIKLSGKNSLAAFLVSSLTIGITVGLIYGLVGPILGLTKGLNVGLIRGLIFGLTAALIVGLNRGGSAVIKYYVLRLTLWWSGYIPLDFVGFLDQCAKLILLKKVGGAYIFIHRMLLEYFADLPPVVRSGDSKRT